MGKPIPDLLSTDEPRSHSHIVRPGQMQSNGQLPSVDGLDSEAWSSLSRIVNDFEAAWRSNQAPQISDFVANCDSALCWLVLVELIRVDQEFSWRCGIRRHVEHYLLQWPSLTSSDDTLVDLISSECLTRAVFETAPSYRELQKRFPNHCRSVPLSTIRSEAKHERKTAAPYRREPSPPGDLPASRSEGTRDRFADLVGTNFGPYRIQRLVVRNHAFASYRFTATGIASPPMLLSLAPVDFDDSGLAFRLFERLAVSQVQAGQYNHGIVNGYLYHVGPEDAAPADTNREDRAMSLLQDGQIIRDTYEVERRLGEGAFAEVYRVRHRFLGRQAMKVFKIVGMTIEETEEMLGEALLLSRIGHPNIVRVFDANITETSRGICGFFTMEYVAGGSLEKFWRSYGARFVPVDTAVNVMTQVCRGLAVAHREAPPMIHRDIKPQNILVGYEADGLRARLSDFGLAKNVNPLTLLASAKGTPSFKSPEVFRDPQSDSCAGDVWSLGATLYLLLTDRLPYFNDDQPDQFEVGRFDRPLLSPGKLNMQVDDELERIILKALAKAPDERYGNADELLQALVAWTPKQPRVLGTTVDWHASKEALGQPSPGDENEARRMIRRAIKMAKQPNKLMEAADLMEEAFNRWPNLRTEHQSQLQLWRRGISM